MARATSSGQLETKVLLAWTLASVLLVASSGAAQQPSPTTSPPAPTRTQTMPATGSDAETTAQVIEEEVSELEAEKAVESEAMADEVNKANNPLADLISISFHNYYFPRLNGVPDESANTFYLRLVTPFWRVIPRVSLPIRVVPDPALDTNDASITGLGALNIFATFVVTPLGRPATVGIGPIYSAPTQTDDLLGSGKHEIGAAALWTWGKGIFLVGSLINWQIGVGGDEDRDRTQFIVAQPFAFFQLGKGYYIRTAPIWFFNIEKPEYNVPFGLGLGKVIATEKIVYNFFIEPQFAMALRGEGQPNTQIFVGMNMQLKTGRKKKDKKNAETAALVNQLASEQELKSQLH